MTFFTVPAVVTTVSQPQTELSMLLLLLLVVVLAVALAALFGYRAANRQLRQNERRQQVVMDTLSEGLVTLDSQRLIRHTNLALQDMFGWQAEELLGKPVQLLLPSSQSGQAPAAPPLPQDGRHQVLQVQARHKDGHRFPVHLSLRRIELQGELHHVGIITNASAMLAMHKSALSARSELDSFVEALSQHSIYSATDANGVILQANEAFCTISGYSLNELVGHDHSIVNSGKHPREFWRQMWQTVKSGHSWNGEVCNRAKDGRLYWVDSLIAPVLDDTGQITRIVSIRHDITARKDYELALEHTQKLLELSNRAAHIGTWDYDLLKHEMIASVVTRELLGFDDHTALPSGIDEIAALVAQSNAQREAYAKAIHEGAGWNLELLSRNVHGEPRWIRSIGLPEFHEGQCVRIHGIVQDIDPMKRREQELAEDKLRLTTLIESNHIGTWEYNRHTQALRCNTHWAEMLGYSLEEAQSGNEATFFQLLHPDDLAHIQQNDLLLSNRTQTQDTFRLRHRDGHWVWVQSRVCVVQRDAQGNPVVLYGAAIDVTPLVQARLEAESAAHSKDQFLATMSHELRTPLNAILGFGQLLDIDDDLSTDQRDNVQEILKASHHLLDLINDVLDLAKINAGRMDFELENVPLADVLADCRALMHPLAQSQQIELLFPSDCPQQLHADRRRLKQVLINLLSNAIKYNQTGGKVTLHLAEGPERLRISICDTGLGMSHEELTKLFQPFQRLKTGQQHAEGTGIGLNITQQLVERMGGQIGVFSTLGTGSTFWFELPLVTEGCPLVSA